MPHQPAAVHEHAHTLKNKHMNDQNDKQPKGKTCLNLFYIFFDII